MEQKHDQDGDLSDFTPTQRRELREALIDAFPERSRLNLLVEDHFGKSLNLITDGEPDYEITVQKLITWAKAEGKVQELLDGAIKEKPGNLKLKKFKEQFSNVSGATRSHHQKRNQERSRPTANPPRFNPAGLIAGVVLILGGLVFVVPKILNGSPPPEPGPNVPCIEGYYFDGEKNERGEYSGWCKSNTGETWYECVGLPGGEKCRKP